MGANMVSMVELMYLTSMVVGLFYVFIACFVIDELSYPGMYLAFSVFFCVVCGQSSFWLLFALSFHLILF
jgi:hypothetical protein